MEAKVQPIEFHGEIADDHGAHKHFKPNPKDLIGKTITNFICDSDNVWSLHFSDGTAVAIEADIDGGPCLPYMTLCNTCWSNNEGLSEIG